MTNNVDYTTTYFKYHVPTPINDEPTNKTLKRLKTELSTNEKYSEKENAHRTGAVFTRNKFFCGKSTFGKAIKKVFLKPGQD